MEPIDLVSVLLRAAGFIAALQATGLAWFVMSCRQLEETAAPALEGLLRLSGLVALTLVLTQRGLDAGRLAGDWSGVFDPGLQAMVWTRRPGLATLVCAAGLLMLIASGGGPIRWRGTAASVGALGVIASFALIGHTTEASHPLALQGLVAVHVGLAAYWIGAVAGLYQLTCRSDLRAAAAAAARFSAKAVWRVPLILPAGGLLVWGLLPDLAALRTPYGGFLFFKALGFSGLILLAARNRFRGVAELTARAPGAVRTFRRVLMAEYVLLGAVLAATATMTSLFSWH